MIRLFIAKHLKIFEEVISCEEKSCAFTFTFTSRFPSTFPVDFLKEAKNQQTNRSWSVQTALELGARASFIIIL